MALLTTFLPKKHKNSNISIKFLITYIFCEGRIDTLCGPRVWDPWSKAMKILRIFSFVIFYRNYFTKINWHPRTVGPIHIGSFTKFQLYFSYWIVTSFFFILEGYAPCKIELDDLISKKKREFGQKSRGKIGAAVSERMNSISGWKPKGMLVAHLHEHQVK